MKDYELLIFDFDGVISNSLPRAIEGINKIGKKYGLPQVERQEDLAELYHRELKNSLFKYGLNVQETKDFYREHAKYMKRHSEEVNAYEGIVDLLQEIPQKKALVTSSYTRAVENILSKENAKTWSIFSRVIGKEVDKSKTDKILTVLKNLGFRKDQATYIGDMASDILYCKDVPIDIISVGYGYQPIGFLKNFNPTNTAETISDLRELLLE